MNTICGPLYATIAGSPLTFTLAGASINGTYYVPFHETGPYAPNWVLPIGFGAFITGVFQYSVNCSGLCGIQWQVDGVCNAGAGSNVSVVWTPATSGALPQNTAYTGSTLSTDCPTVGTFQIS
jgi:hypothetical protein